MEKTPENETLITYEEVDELILLIRQIYGFDFSGYSRASFQRRLNRIMQKQGARFYDLKSTLINDQSVFQEILNEVTVNVTEMFRDPWVFQELKKEILPYLASFHRLKIWIAGCSSGEELYSYAILLKEASLLEKSFLYGTDINSVVLEQAREGLYNLSKLKTYSENYLASGGSGSLSDYYTARYDAGILHPSLRKNTLFSVHNLVTDGVFNEFQLISCRNVLIYFGIELQEHVQELFYKSLSPFGFLCLGSKENIRDPLLMKHFKEVNKAAKIYQKIS